MAAAARKVNWFAIWVSIAVVAVLVGVGGVVVWMNSLATAPGAQPTASNIDTATGAIMFGEGSDELDTYIDFMCPVCAQFEEVYGEEISRLVDDGSITLNLHPIAILDSRSQGTAFSSRAASAMYSVAIADPDGAMDFMQAMYANQPQEGTTGLSDEEIVGIAEASGVTMTEDLETSITSGRYVDYVQTMTPKTPVQPGAAGIGTPTVSVNGTVIANSALPADPADLMDLFATG